MYVLFKGILTIFVKVIGHQRNSHLRAEKGVGCIRGLTTLRKSTHNGLKYFFFNSHTVIDWICYKIFLENTNTVIPRRVSAETILESGTCGNIHIVATSWQFFYFINWIVAMKTIKEGGGKLFKGGNYLLEYGI